MQSSFGPIFGVLCGGSFFLLFGGIGAFLLYKAYKARQQSDLSQGWPSVQGQVTGAHVSHSSSTDTDGNISYSYSPNVSYTYQVGGNTYHNDKLTFGFQQTFNNEARAQTALQRYPVGGNVTVYYNPANPSEAVLERAAGGFAISLVIGILFVFIALCAACTSLVWAVFAIGGKTITY
jgi:hypothetical protein